jgi:hypothetical protein
MATKEEIKTISQIAYDTMIQSEEFKKILQEAVEIGFTAGANAMNTHGHDICELLAAKDHAVDVVRLRLLKTK